jgi:hypothetical protein
MEMGTHLNRAVSGIHDGESGGFPAYIYFNVFVG